MLVKPSENITESLGTKISEAREMKTKSCLNQPKFAAEHLRTKEDLSMFYGEASEAEWVIAIVTAVKVAVAAGALVAAAVLAVNGPNAASSGELENLTLAEVEDLNINELLEARRKVLV